MPSASATRGFLFIFTSPAGGHGKVARSHRNQALGTAVTLDAIPRSMRVGQPAWLARIGNGGHRRAMPLPSALPGYRAYLGFRATAPTWGSRDPETREPFINAKYR